MVSLQVSDLILAGLTAAQLRERVEAQIMRRRFEPFARAAFGARHPTKVLKWTWAHGAICEHLEACKLGQIRRLIINVPPRNLKSHLTSVALPAWWWIDSPATQFLAISADEKIVFRDADALRDLGLAHASVTEQFHELPTGAVFDTHAIHDEAESVIA